MSTDFHDPQPPVVVKVRPLGYADPPQQLDRPKKRLSPIELLFIVLVVGGAAFAAWDFFRPASGAARESALRSKCAANLWQIGQGVMLYAEKNGGKLPMGFDPLISDVQLSTDLFVCPGSADEKAIGADVRATLADFGEKGRCSYVYVGAGMTNRVKGDVVVAYERFENHDKGGMNVLYVEGRVKGVGKEEAEHVIKELEARRNPPNPKP